MKIRVFLALVILTCFAVGSAEARLLRGSGAGPGGGGGPPPTGTLLTTATYVNNTAGTVASGTPLLMAQAFLPGAVFTASNCAVPRNAVTHNPLIWQHDNTATRRENGGDGSVRHWTFGALTDAAVLAGAKYTIEWVATGAACPAQTQHHSLANLAAAHDLKLNFTSVTNQDLTIRGSGSLTFDINTAAGNTGRDAPIKYATGPVYDGWRIAGVPTWDAASSGHLIGAQLSPTQIGIGNWTGITNGSFHVVVDGTPHDVTAINLSGAADLTAVAGVINGRMSAAGAGATISWKPTDEISHFEIASSSTGTGSTVSLLTAVGSGTDISGKLLMNMAGVSYNSAINAYTYPGVAAGSKDPLLYVVCYVDVSTLSDGTTMGKVRNVCTTYNGWMSVAAGVAGRAGNPGPAGYPNDPQTINYRAALNDGSHSLIDFSAMFDATVNTSSTPIFLNASGGQNCSRQDFIPSCWIIPGSSGSTPWERGGAHVFSTTGTAPTCYWGAGAHGAVSSVPCTFSPGHLYFDFPGGTSGGNGLDSTYVTFSDIQGTSQGAIINPTSQGTGTVTWSSRIAHTHWMSWFTLAPDDSEPWSDGTSVSYAPWLPAFDQGTFTGERKYWEETGTLPPISLTQTPTVSYNFLQDGNYFYQPMGRGPLTGGNGTGNRPDLGVINQFAAQAWITQAPADWFHQRTFSTGEGVYPFNSVLNETTGRIPPLNNGPPVPPGGGAGGSYGALGTALQNGTTDFAWLQATGGLTQFNKGAAPALEGVPQKLAFSGDGTQDLNALYGSAWWDDGCCYMDHQPEFEGLNYLVFGQAYQLDIIYNLADNATHYDAQQTLAGQPTYYAQFIGQDEIRGGWWMLRDITKGAAFGDDSRDERNLFNDVLHENYYANQNWLAFVDGVAPSATATLSASPTTISSGGSSMLTWSSTNASSCTGTGFSTSGLTSGSVSTGALTVNMTYGINCGGAIANATVTVTGGGGGITVAQSFMTVLYPQYPGLVASYTMTLPQPATVGCSIFGGALFEPAASPSGSTAGPIDTVMVGSEAATIDHITTENAGIGPAMATFHLFNTNNAATGITVSSSGGGHFIQESIAFSEICGLFSGASVDAQNGLWGRMPAAPATWVSPTVTPTQTGDFLYGIMFNYDFSANPAEAGPGWTLINNCRTVPSQCAGASGDIFSPGQEYQSYNSSSPVAATFSVPTAFTNSEAWAGIIAVKTH